VNPEDILKLVNLKPRVEPYDTAGLPEDDLYRKDTGGFVASLDDEYFTGETYSSAEEAVRLFPVEEGLSPGDRFYVGQKIPYETYVDAHALLDRIKEDAWDKVGESCDGWLTGISNFLVAELSCDLNKVLLGWLNRHGHSPTFFGIENVTTHVVPDVYLDGFQPEG
jgi:hypothetical protein